MERIQVEFTFTAEKFAETHRHILWKYFSTGWLKWILVLLAAIWILKKLIYDGTVEFIFSVAIMAMFLGLWWLIFKW